MILITGAAGFIGYHVTARLLADVAHASACSVEIHLDISPVPLRLSTCGAGVSACHLLIRQLTAL
jgi:nucleoside-diphosphate-sugar epimerase